MAGDAVLRRFQSSLNSVFYIKAKEMLVMSKVAQIKNVHLKSVVRHLKSNTKQFSKRLGLLNSKIPNST